MAEPQHAPPPPRPDFGLAVVSDIGCAWAHIAVHRVRREIRARGLDVELPLDHRAFPLELVDGGQDPEEMLEQVVAFGRRIEPEAGWHPPDSAWSVPESTLLALEAVQAAKAQGAGLSVALDGALRRAVFVDGARVWELPVVLAIAARIDGLDADRLHDELGTGRPRSETQNELDQLRAAVPGSPTFVLPDGSIAFNPGVEVEWRDGVLTVEDEGRAALAELVTSAAAMRPAD